MPTHPTGILGWLQPWKPAGVRGHQRGCKDPSLIPLCDPLPFACTPQRLSVGVNTSNTQYLHKNTKDTTTAAIRCPFLAGTKIWIHPKGHCQLKFQWLSNSLLFDFSPVGISCFGGERIEVVVRYYYRKWIHLKKCMLALKHKYLFWKYNSGIKVIQLKWQCKCVIMTHNDDR